MERYQPLQHKGMPRILVGQVWQMFWKRHILLYLCANLGIDDLSSTSRDGPQLQIAPGVHLALLPVDRPKPGRAFPKTDPTARVAPNRKASMAGLHPTRLQLYSKNNLLPSPRTCICPCTYGPGTKVPWYRTGTSGRQPSAKLTQGPDRFCGGGTLCALARPCLTPSQTDREVHTFAQSHRPRKCHPHSAKLFL